MTHVPLSRNEKMMLRKESTAGLPPAEALTRLARHAQASAGDDDFLRLSERTPETQSSAHYSTMMPTRKVLILLGVSATALVAIGVAVIAAALISARNDDNKGATGINPLEGLEEAPTVAPTASHAPTQAPSDEPSAAPSTAPSFPPSQTPTSRPSVPPTSAPSPQPSSAPTQAPSSTPSHAPTSRPSATPSAAPTRVATPSPTFTPITRKFRLKMHWEDHYRWQDDPDEKFYCLACARCRDVNFSEDSRQEYGCESSDCERDRQLWIRDCRDGYGAEFRVVDAASDGYLIGVSGTGVCMERTGNRFVTLQDCDTGSDRQKWTSFSGTDGHFALSPVYTDVHYCLSQHHHPKVCFFCAVSLLFSPCVIFNSLFPHLFCFSFLCNPLSTSLELRDCRLEDLRGSARRRYWVLGSVQARRLAS